MSNHQKLKVSENISHICPKYEKYFGEDYYKYNNIWCFHDSSGNYLIRIPSYNIVHKILGCERITRLGNKCPNEIIVPMATLLCIIPKCYLYKCLYRSEDEAIGIESKYGIMYLTPTNVLVDNKFGFEDVTLNSPRILLTSRSK